VERPRPPLVAIRAFEAVARHRSVRQAATATHTSHTVVSRHVRNLETWLGVTLLQRTARGIALTAEGEAYFQSISGPLDRIDFASAEMRRLPHAATIKFWIPTGFFRIVCLPRLAALREAVDPTEIVFRPTILKPDLEMGEADIHVSWNPFDDVDPESECLCRPNVFPVLGGAMRSLAPSLKTPSDLLAQPLLHEESQVRWHEWFREAGIVNVPHLRGLTLWTGDLTKQAAVLGQGISLSNDLLSAQELARGDLVRLFPQVKVGSAYQLHARAGMKNSGVYQAIRAWLHQGIIETLDTTSDGA
jgi:DNA-binding transcriptional LysR family regulator